MKTFLNGLSIFIPIAVILYILVWILEVTENIFGTIILLFLPKEFYITGMGVLTGIIVIYFMGLLLKFWIGKKMKAWFEAIIDKTPILGSIYGSITDFFDFSSSLKDKKRDIVVLVDLPAIEGKIIGFITAESFKDFNELDMDEPVLVYLQMSYQVGGYSVFIPRKNLTILKDRDFESTLRYVLTAGISSDKKKPNINDEEKKKC